MTAKTRRDRPWDTDGYQTIRNARHDAGELVVCFDDGTEARIDVARLTRVAERTPDWSALTYDDFEVVVPTQDGDVEIPWLPIRSMSDPAFRAYLDAAAAEQAQWIGRRLRELRQDRDLDVGDVAERVGLDAETLADLEQGRVDVDLPTVERVLAGLGHDFSVLERPETEARVSVAQPA